IIGSGRLRETPVFDASDLALFNARSGARSRLDRTLIANSFGGAIAGLTGSSTCTVYIESVTGIAAGGRTGLSSLVVSLLFFACLPLIGFFSVIPVEAVAPALVVAGLYPFSLVARIEWDRIEHAIPCGLTILVIPVTYSIMNGITVGLLSHIVMHLALGKARSLNPVLVVIAVALLAVNGIHHLLGL
ncbi:MAG: hypothetical protein LIP77_10725, partial [Planctomycetes bacterium]|nr:hypothetical protein [Planctomycetota bacterium]